jgi:hypothetical protein
MNMRDIREETKTSPIQQNNPETNLEAAKKNLFKEQTSVQR